MVSMLNSIAEQELLRSVTFVQAARNSYVHAMKAHVAELASKYEHVHSYVCYSAPSEKDREVRNYDKEGYIDLPWLKSVVSEHDADFYFCGPIPFMKAVYRMLMEWGVKEENLHYEFFGPADNLVEHPIETATSVQ